MIYSGMQLKNIICDNFTGIIRNKGFAKYAYSFLSLYFFLNIEALYAQPVSSNKADIITVKQEKENLNVFQDWIAWSNPGGMVMNHLTKQAVDLYKKRRNQIVKIKTKDDWRKRQQVVKGKLKEIFGAFPEKSALNPEITGIVQKDGYRIEKIIFEPMSGYYETGCLYIPDNLNGKAPAILNVMGHDQASFREEYYQVIITNLVKKGMIVFAIDPLGQGEHVQYYDTTLNFSAAGYSVNEHIYMGNICFLTGTSSAKYFIWDGIRAIDYLLTRKEVDVGRIGVTGFSGGGTVSAYIAAVDKRVKVAIPCSWSIENRSLIETKGVQDPESMLVHGLAKGITFEDLLEVRSPKPTLLTFTYRDEYLSFQGAKNAFVEAKKAYKAFGRADHLQMVVDEGKHAMTPKIRLAMYAFFQKHFGLQGNPAEEKTDLPSKKELTVTPTGQITTYKGGKMIFDFNKTESEKLINNINGSRKNIIEHLENVKKEAKKISGYNISLSSGEQPVMNGRYKRDGYSVELMAITGEQGNYAIPILLFIPDGNRKNHPAIVYLHSKGKTTGAETGGEIEKLVKQGYIVAAADVLGFGETTQNPGSRYKSPDGYTATLIGRSMVGIRAGDIVRVVSYLKNRNDVDPSKIGAVAYNDICPALIHAAAFDSSIINVTLIGSLISYQSVVMNKLYKVGVTKIVGNDYWHPVDIDFSWGIASVLTAYDLPDMIGSIAPRKIILAELKDHLLEPASPKLIKKELEFPRSVYSFKKLPENFKVLEKMESLSSAIDWGFKK
ncbi:MAG: acetylxylan esterase [Bacteroidetes bacterium]|nr:acetylxylan esterase [Bacteroidota bacterium]